MVFRTFVLEQTRLQSSMVGSFVWRFSLKALFYSWRSVKYGTTTLRTCWRLVSIPKLLIPGKAFTVDTGYTTVLPAFDEVSNVDSRAGALEPTWIHCYPTIFAEIHESLLLCENFTDVLGSCGVPAVYIILLLFLLESACTGIDVVNMFNGWDKLITYMRN